MSLNSSNGHRKPAKGGVSRVGTKLMGAEKRGDSSFEEFMIWSELHGDVKRPFGGGWQGCSCQQTLLSCDAFLGLPFNISCYALLTYMLAHYFELKPRDLVISFGDVHIYENHLESVQEQLKRIPYQIPELMIDCDPKQVLEAPLEAFRVVGYRSHGKLTGEVAV